MEKRFIENASWTLAGWPAARIAKSTKTTKTGGNGWPSGKMAREKAVKSDDLKGGRVLVWVVFGCLVGVVI